MAVIAKLDVLITATAKNFTQGTKAATRGLTNFNKNVGQTSMGLGNLTSKFSLGKLGVAGFAASVALAGIKLQKMVKELNIVDASLKASSRSMGLQLDELDRFHSAMEAVNGTGAQFNTAFGEMTRRIAEAKQGTGELHKIFREYGMDMKRLEGITPIQQLKEMTQIMDEIQAKTGDIGAVRRVAQATFGRTGAREFLEVIRSGELSSAFRDIAGTSKVTKANIEASARAGEAWKSATAELKREWDSLLRSIGLTGFTETMASLMRETAGMIRWYREGAESMGSGGDSQNTGAIPRNEIAAPEAPAPSTAGRQPAVLEYRNLMRGLAPSDI